MAVRAWRHLRNGPIDRPGEQVKAGERASVVMRMMITTKGEGRKQHLVD